MKIYLIRKGETFLPLSVEDHDRLKRIKEGGIILIDYKKPRNPLFHNKFMSMVRTVFDNQEQYTDIENLLSVLKVELGHYDTMFYRDLKIRIPRSISFAKMDELQFTTFYDRAVTVCLSHFLPATTPAELEEYVAKILRY